MKKLLVSFFVLSLGLGLAVSGCTTQSIKSGDPDAVPGCDSPLGFIAEGQTATGYLRPVESSGQSCQQGTLTCEDGKWTGAHIYPSCVVTP